MRASLLERIRFSYTVAVLGATLASGLRKLASTAATTSVVHAAGDSSKLDGNPACTVRAA